MIYWLIQRIFFNKQIKLTFCFFYCASLSLSIKNSSFFFVKNNYKLNHSREIRRKLYDNIQISISMVIENISPDIVMQD